MKVPGTVVLQGVLGSHAYGLARPDSDEDRKGVFVADALDLLGLHPPKETVVHTDPDYEFHELGKFCRLALNCNPTVLEQLWLGDEGRYEVLGMEGASLLNARSAFLSRRRVKSAFGGYAMAQIQRLQRRGDGTFSSDTKNRREKHARHCFRLLAQGTQLLATGTMRLKVEDPERLFAIGRMDDEDMTKEFDAANETFLGAAEDSCLPEAPDEGLVDELICEIRRLHIGS
jgi:hypothetical protein